MWGLVLKILGFVIPLIFGGDQKRDDLVKLGETQNENKHLEEIAESQKEQTAAWANRPDNDDDFAAKLRKYGPSDIIT